MEIQDTFTWMGREVNGRLILRPEWISNQIGATSIFHAVTTAVETKFRIQAAESNYDFPRLCVQHLIDCFMNNLDRPNMVTVRDGISEINEVYPEAVMDYAMVRGIAAVDDYTNEDESRRGEGGKAPGEIHMLVFFFWYIFKGHLYNMRVCFDFYVSKLWEGG